MYVGHVRCEVEELRVLDLISNLLSRRGEAFQMNRQDHRRFVNRKVLLRRDELLASAQPCQSRRELVKKRNALFTLVFVGSFQHVDPNELSESVLDRVDPLNVETEIEHRVEGVGGVLTSGTRHSRSQSTAKDLVDERRLFDLDVEFPVAIVCQFRCEQAD